MPTASTSWYDPKLDPRSCSFRDRGRDGTYAHPRRTPLLPLPFPTTMAKLSFARVFPNAQLVCVSLRVFYAVQPKMCDTLVDALERVFAENLVGEPFDFLGRNGDEYRR